MSIPKSTSAHEERSQLPGIDVHAAPTMRPTKAKGRRLLFFVAVAVTMPLVVGYASIAAWAYYQFGTMRSMAAFLDGQQLILEPETLDAGSLNSGSIKVMQIQAVNLTAETIQINGAMSYCARQACLEVDDQFPIAIPPRQKRPISVTLKVNPPEKSRSGAFTYSTNVHTQIGTRPFAISGNIVDGAASGSETTN